MTVRSPTYLKSRFETGDIPTATDFGDIFDSYFSVGTSASQTFEGNVNFTAGITVSGGTLSNVNLQNITGLSVVSSALDTIKANLEITNTHYYKVVQDADNSAALNALISLVSSQNGGVIIISEGNMNNGRIVPKSNVFLIGSGRRTTFKTTIRRNAIYQDVSTEDLINFGVFNCRFIGEVTEDVTQPQHSRTTSGFGITTAFEIHGDLEPTSSFAGAGGTKKGIYFCNNWVEKCSSLPILIGGATDVFVNNNVFDNNKDVGIRFCKNVQCNNNRVMNSADNGISLSRGNENVVATGNLVNNCAYDGIWLGGVGTDEGCKNFSVTGNTITDVGYNGINAKLAAKNGVISGNFIRQGYWRGPIDQISNINSGTGVTVGGIPDHSSATTDWAQNILVTGNTIMECSRAGLFSTGGTKNCSMYNNKVLNAGNQYAADGVTAITTADQTTNAGIIFENVSANSNIQVYGNQIDDNRGTSYMNYLMIPTVENSSFSLVKENNGNGSWRNPSTYPWVTGFKQGYATGSSYSLTATSALVVFGTSQADVTIRNSGLHKVQIFVNLRYNGATFASSRTVTLIAKKYDGSTYTTLSNGTRTLYTDIVTTKTATFQNVVIEVSNTTLLSGESVVLFADVSVLPSAGSLDINDLSISASKL